VAKNNNKLADVQPERLKSFLKRLVDIYSPSGKEDEAIKLAERYLKKHGLTAIRQKVDRNRYNLLVLPPKRNKVELCFVGHMDTVAAYDLDDYAYREEGDRIFGLGTADMKAGCAAMIELFVVLAEGGGTFPPVSLALVVDEEEDNKGAETLVKEYSFPWAIVGEPTSLIPCLGNYGYLEVMLNTQGKRAHSAMPELGQNAIENMLKLLMHISGYITSKSQFVYNIRELSGFPHGFVVPDSCEAWLDIHIPPNSRVDILKAELEQEMGVAHQNIPGLDAHLKFEDTYSGYQISEESTFVQKLKKVYQKLSLPWKPQDFRSHSDGNTLWTAGINPITLGPGSLESAHTPEESVFFSQVVQAAQLYLCLAQSLI
jgi:acetylornithine deacetylase